MGVWLNGSRIPKSDFQWFLKLGVPCFIIQEVKEAPQGGVFTSFLEGTSIETLANDCPFDRIAKRAGGRVVTTAELPTLPPPHPDLVYVRCRGSIQARTHCLIQNADLSTYWKATDRSNP